MGDIVSLKVEDGEEIPAYLATASKPRGRALVVLQEFFGLNSHMRSVADRFAALGYDVIVPDLFHRLAPNVAFDYSPEGIAGGRRMRALVSVDDSLKDIRAAIEHIGGGPSVGTIGYCWGGTLAFLSAARLDDVACSIGYYGSQIIDYLGEPPKVPLMLHFGDSDASIPLTDVEKIHATYPNVPVHVYPGRHGFNCDERANFVPGSSAIALERSLAFFDRHLV
jgi:carboxymethylenebutenolidase